MARISAEQIIKENQMPSSPQFQAVDSGFSTASESDDGNTISCINSMVKDDMFGLEQVENSSSDDDEDWCTYEDIETDDDDASEILSIESILGILSAVTFPDDMTARHRTLREEVLDHELIYHRTWIRVKRECTGAVMVCKIICFLCSIATYCISTSSLPQRWTLNLIWRRHSLLVIVLSRGN